MSAVTPPEKAITYIRGYFQHAPTFIPLQALDILLKYATGLRKDGVTPEWAHSVYVMMWLMHHDDTLDTIAYHVYTVAFLHDTVEDHKVMLEAFERKFAWPVDDPDSGGMNRYPDITHSVKLLSKVRIDRPKKKSPEDYYLDIAEDEAASLVKGSDRIDNLRTMRGAFTREKQRSYIAETRELVIPMIKEARHNFGKRRSVYQSIKWTLHVLCDEVEARLDVEDKLDAKS